MLRYLTIAIFASGLVLSSPVSAAQIFNKPQSAVETPQAPPAQPAPDLQPRNNNVLELLDEAPAPQAPEPEPENINDFANQYYKNCMQQEHPLLKGETLKTLCACTSANIPGNMSVANMRNLNEDTEEGAKQRARLMLFVYTPCIQYPTKALVEDQCLKNPDVRKNLKNYKGVCMCLSDGMADFMEEYAQQHMEAALRRDMRDTDPLNDLMNSPRFNSQSQYYMRTCIQKHEWGQ